MFRLTASLTTALLPGACATTTGSADTAGAAAPKARAKACDDEPVTGSRIHRCDRSAVVVIQREELGRRGGAPAIPAAVNTKGLKP